MTVVFPDSLLPEPSNGGFQTQEEFWKFVTANQDGHWNSELHSSPYVEYIADYKDDSIADAFPLLFPFGFTGLPKDSAVLSLHEKRKQLLTQTHHNVFVK